MCDLKELKFYYFYHLTDEKPIFHHSVHVQEQQDADYIEGR